MSRTLITDGSGRWFDHGKAEFWRGEREWDGHNMACKHVGANRGQNLWRTASGAWILETWSQWQGEPNRYEPITTAEAARWFSINGNDPESLPKVVREDFARLEIP